MSDNQEPVEGNLADSIAMLEQILEVMPQDGVALKAIYNAFKNSGQEDKAFEYLNRLIEVAICGDAELLVYVQGELVDFEQSHPSEVAAQAARLRTLAEEAVDSPAAPMVPETPMDREEPQKAEVDISEELALAWKLYEENQLSQEEYSSVLHDLTEVSSKDLDVPVSVLHVLHDRGFTQMNRIMNYLSSRSSVPFVSLSNFELSEKEARALPLAMPAHDGALPFGFMGNDLLVAVLNPFNYALVDKIEAESGHRCHTYLVSAEDYDLALGKLRGLVQVAA